MGYVRPLYGGEFNNQHYPIARGTKRSLYDGAIAIDYDDVWSSVWNQATARYSSARAKLSEAGALPDPDPRNSSNKLFVVELEGILNQHSPFYDYKNL